MARTKKAATDAAAGVKRKSEEPATAAASKRARQTAERPSGEVHIPRAQDQSATSKKSASKPEAKQADTKPSKTGKTTTDSDVQSSQPKETAEEAAALKKQRKSEKIARREAGAENGNVSLVDASSNPDWDFSVPTAGRFISHDPIFVRDEEDDEYILAATDISVEVLSIKTSLPVHKCPAPAGAKVRGFALSKASPYTVYIAYNTGSIQEWGWTEDAEASTLVSTSGTIKALETVATVEGQADTLVYIRATGRQHEIFLGEKSLYTTERNLQSLQVLGDAQYIVAHSEDAIVLGGRKPSDSGGFEFVWVEIPMISIVTSIGARIAPTEGAKKDQKPFPEINLAIGTDVGKIQYFEHGISALFARNGDRTLPVPRTLHWHRDAVAGVKFSQDGNYIISGGSETVLVLWQLSTGVKQFLPHLTSTIERVVVSPQGDQYAVQMDDNSIMVLSTSELKPVANFAGLQLVPRLPIFQQDFNAAVMNPREPNQLLLAVPSSKPKEAGGVSTRPFLQTFDMRNSRHVTRQALARNNVTDFNLGPENTPITPPDVTHMQISPDGLWLATVDEWMPSSSDLVHLASVETKNAEFERRKRREVFLKIWRWQAAEGIWTLTTRVDGPHAHAGGEHQGAGKVMALAADPSGSGFATVGEDNAVRLWKSKTRMRHGVALTDADQNELTEWTCKRTIPLLSNAIPRADTPLSASDSIAPDSVASLAYSEDGSMIAAAVQNLASETNGSVIHFIDTTSGSVVSKPNVAPAGIVAMGFLDRYLITASSGDVRVWDIVDDRLHRRIKLGNDDEDLPLLAVNHRDATFAVAVGDRLSVYSPQHSKPICRSETSTDLAAVLANGKGYTLLFTDATTRTLNRSGLSQRLGHLPEVSTEEITAPAVQSTDDMEIDADEEIAIPASQTLALPEHEDDRPVVRPEQLAGIFDVGQSFAMPPVKDMFQAVAGLFGRRPNPKIVSAVAV